GLVFTAWTILGDSSRSFTRSWSFGLGFTLKGGGLLRSNSSALARCSGVSLIIFGPPLSPLALPNLHSLRPSPHPSNLVARHVQDRSAGLASALRAAVRPISVVGS